MYKPRLQLWERSAHPKVARTETDTVTTTERITFWINLGEGGLTPSLDLVI